MKTTTILPLALLLAASCGKSGSKGSTPLLTVNDITINEGNGGTNNVEVSLALNQAPGSPVTISWSTMEGSAKAGSDFTAATNQSVTFGANEKEKKITVSVVADDLREPDEVFQVKLTGTAGVALMKSTINITLKNDDTKIAFNNSGYDATGNYPGYTLAWSDEFNGTELAADAWGFETGDGCPGLCGWGNNELQYYTPPPNNLFFQDGKMIIEAKAESFGGKNYTSTRLKTQGKKAFKFGRIDIRAILPKGRGVWPAFWLLPQDNVFGGWPRSGEIDLMEYIGSETNRVLGTVHYGPGPGSIYSSKNYILPAGTFNDQFHVFSLEWKQDEIKWFVDDNLYATFTKADAGANNYPFNEKFFFLINMAVGGNLPGPPDASTVFPQFLIVDYIRIYQ
jgi:beta-glucanase (GH16 family)